MNKNISESNIVSIITVCVSLFAAVLLFGECGLSLYQMSPDRNPSLQKALQLAPKNCTMVDESATALFGNSSPYKYVSFDCHGKRLTYQCKPHNFVEAVCFERPNSSVDDTE